LSRREKIKSLYAVKSEPEKLAMANLNHPAELNDQRVLAGPVRTMGLALDRIEEESRAIQLALSAGAAVVELDPSLVDVSIVRDRFDGVDDGFEAFKKSIQDHGQEVPILVRPHPKLEGRYQVAYGHRRLRAAEALGWNVRAVVRKMTDAELVIAQGVENSARRDLTYIEKAIFARRLEDKGFDRTVIMDALSTDKGELSKLISVARAVPQEIVEAIGPAPKAGRRRWLVLAELMGTEQARRAVERAVRSISHESLDTDERFRRVLTAAFSTSRTGPQRSAWRSVSGQASAKITRSQRGVVLAIDQNPEFGEFIASQLDELYEAFQSRARAGG
jgi:ParB family transcriptional regulator, chromosome partitioning protein